jgi:hypothetical protein
MYFFYLCESRFGNHYFELILSILNPLRVLIYGFAAFPHTSYGVIQIKPPSWFCAENPERIECE